MNAERPTKAAPAENSAEVVDIAAAREAAATTKAAEVEARANAPVSVSETDRAAILEKTSDIIGRYRAADALLTAFAARQERTAGTMKEDDLEEGYTSALTASQVKIAAREALEDAVRDARDYNLADARKVIDAYPNDYTEMEFFAAAKRAEEILGTPA